MIEIVTVDGKQFELATEYPLTEQQKQQTISDIRKQTGCSSCNKTQSLGGNIQTLYAPCIDVIVQAPATISVANVTISGVDCASGTCPTITCGTLSCDSITRDIVVTYTNSGDQPGDVTPTLTVNTVAAIGIRSPVGLVAVPAGGSAIVTFSGVTLSRGPNNICAGQA